MKVLFLTVIAAFVVVLSIDVSFGEDDEKKEDADSTAPATLATPSALFKCGQVRKYFLRQEKVRALDKING
jgi:hypothetical protein